MISSDRGTPPAGYTLQTNETICQHVPSRKLKVDEDALVDGGDTWKISLESLEGSGTPVSPFEKYKSTTAVRRRSYRISGDVFYGGKGAFKREVSPGISCTREEEEEDLNNAARNLVSGYFSPGRGFRPRGNSCDNARMSNLPVIKRRERPSSYGEFPAAYDMFSSLEEDQGSRRVSLDFSRYVICIYL